MVAITIILGGIVAGDLWNKAVIIFTLLVFVLNLGEEIAAGAMDMEGDKQRNIKSIAILYGGRKLFKFLLFYLL